MGHRRLYNHHRHDRSKIERLVRDIRGETARLHDAVESASSVPDESTKIGDLVEDIQGETVKLRDAVDFANGTGTGDASSGPTLERTIERLRIIFIALGMLLDDLTGGPQPVPTPEPDPEHGHPHPQPQPKPEPAPQPKPPAPAPQPAPQQPPSGIQWPSFTGKDALVGHSPSGMVSVYVDASLGAQAVKNAEDLLADADRVVGINDALFGRKQTVPVRVLLFAMGATDGTGGADHMGCDWRTGGDIEVCVDYGNSARCSALFEAELSECAMNNQLCGLSTGEALSRWCAAIVSNNALADFATAPEWQRAQYPDWVNNVENTDQGAESIGCGMAFISYLLHRGATLPQIAQTMVRLGDSGTLAALYGALKMGDAALAWPTFLAAVRATTITSDDPFAQVKMAMSQHEHI